MILDTSGAMSIIIAMDNDEAGQRATELITNKCQKIYNIHKINISGNDIGEMNTDQIQKEILPQLEKII
jgi:hypothetical protein